MWPAGMAARTRHAAAGSLRHRATASATMATAASSAVHGTRRPAAAGDGPGPSALPWGSAGSGSATRGAETEPRLTVSSLLARVRPGPPGDALDRERPIL